MKKAKIVLFSLAVLAVVGGALAFEAHPFNSSRLYCQCQNGECTIPITGITIVEDGSSTRPNPCTTLGARITKFGLEQTTLPCSLTAEVFYNSPD